MLIFVLRLHAQADAKQRADNIAEVQRLLAAEKERQRLQFKWEIEKLLHQRVEAFAPSLAAETKRQFVNSMVDRGNPALAASTRVLDAATATFNNESHIWQAKLSQSLDMYCFWFQRWLVQTKLKMYRLREHERLLTEEAKKVESDKEAAIKLENLSKVDLCRSLVWSRCLLLLQVSRLARQLGDVLAEKQALQLQITAVSQLLNSEPQFAPQLFAFANKARYEDVVSKVEREAEVAIETLKRAASSRYGGRLSFV